LCDSETLKNIIAALAVVVGALSAYFALKTFHHNTRTKAAEFLSNLHKSFFVDETYKKVRSVLDDDSEGAEITLSKFIKEEPPEFTDFLNFFELVAYMGSEKTLSKKDVEALLGYYLQTLSDKPLLRKYIQDKKNGFEHLDMLLTTRQPSRE